MCQVCDWAIFILIIKGNGVTVSQHDLTVKERKKKGVGEETAWKIKRRWEDGAEEEGRQRDNAHLVYGIKADFLPWDLDQTSLGDLVSRPAIGSILPSQPLTLQIPRA